jgi:hypothetical protein
MASTTTATPADVKIKATKIRTSVPVFFSAKIRKQCRRSKAHTVRYFCNTAIRESDIPRSLATKAGIAGKEDKTATAFFAVNKVDPATKIEFVIVEDGTSPDGRPQTMNLGMDALRKMKLVIDSSAGHPNASKKGKVKKADAEKEDAAAAPEGSSSES